MNKKGIYIGIKMDFIIGGAFQGKEEYVIKTYSMKEQDIFHGSKDILPQKTDGFWKSKKAIEGFHLLVLQWMKEGRSAEQMTEHLLEENPDIIIISNEIGCGIVPMDAMEREWREKTGRICCLLAKKANQVIRVQCGIGKTIKNRKNKLDFLK